MNEEYEYHERTTRKPHGFYTEARLSSRGYIKKIRIPRVKLIHISKGFNIAYGHIEIREIHRKVQFDYTTIGHNQTDLVHNYEC